MASTKEIKNRIKSVQDTQKITNAMYLISSTKMRKAKAAFDNTRPYFRILKSEIKRIFRNAPDAESRYFYPEDKKDNRDKCAFLVVTADKGLAGAYNQNVLKETKKQLDRHKDSKLYVVGEYGRQYFIHHHIEIEKSFLYTAQNPTIDRAREICEVLLEAYDDGEIDKIYIIYTDMKNSMSEEVAIQRLLPFHRSQFINPEEKPVKNKFEFVPSVTQVLDSVTRNYIAGFVYGALVDSFCSEQNARMAAMSAANQNAESILHELKIQFNRVRQAAITQEITEVSSGAKAQKRKKLEEVMRR